LRSILKKAARAALHDLGGLAALRAFHRGEFGVLMFHSFTEAERANNMDAVCRHIAQHFEPVSRSTIVDAIEQGRELPDNAIAITVDDGYRNFLFDGHPVFRKHGIPTTVYPVAAFSAGRIWLWPDQIEFGIRHTVKQSITAFIRTRKGLNATEYSLATPEERAAAIDCVREAGYSSAVTCSWGLNPIGAEPLEIRRIPFDSAIEYRYGVELLAGLHM